MRIFVIYSQEVSNYSNDSIDFVCAFKLEPKAKAKLADLRKEQQDLEDFSKDYWISEPIEIVD